MKKENQKGDVQFLKQESRSISSTVDFLMTFPNTNVMKPLEKTLKQLAVVVMVLMITIPVKGQWGTGTNPNDIYNTNTGNVGIGTTVPGAKLEVEIGAGTAEFDKGIVIHSGNGTFTSGHGNMLQFENEDVVVAGIRGDREGGWAGDLQFFTHLNSPGNTYGTTFTEKMRITATGNVGIGKTDPSVKLDVIGTGTNGSVRITSPTDVTQAFHLELFEPQGTAGVRPISLRFHQSSTTWGRLEHGTGGFHFKTGDPASQAYRDVSMGSLYINKSNAQLHLVSPDANRAQMTIYTQGDGANDLFFGTNGQSQRYSVSGRNSSEGYNLKIYRNNGGWNEMMVFDWATGNVGIGTPAPAERLHVTGGGTSGETIQIGNYTAIGEQYSSGATIIGDNVKPDNSPIIGMATITTHASTGGRAIEMHLSMGIAFHTSTGSVTAGGAYTSERMRIDNTGNVGIGASNPDAKLTIVRPAGTVGLKIQGATTEQADIILRDPDSAVDEKSMQIVNVGGSFQIRGLNDAENTVRTNIFAAALTTGNVGIGTINPTQKLTVNGKILAEEVEVIADVLPDYVFKEDYKLMSLAELDKFIKANKHLPEVPSEKEVCDNGSKIGLGEMNHLLLKKIEELTLYTLQQNEQIKQLQDQINAIH